MKTLLLPLAGSALALLLAPPAFVWAGVITLSDSFPTALVIPDNDPTGVSDTRNFSMTGAPKITDILVTIDIAGGFNGDYYAYLRHGNTGFAVLLNRVGVTSSNPDGYSDAGLKLSLSDSAPNGDIHLYQTLVNPNGASLTGLWQPDGRNTDPSLVSDLTPRTALLSSFDGLNPNGDWTLFITDTSPLGRGTLMGWGLTVTGDVVAVPDGSTGITGLVAMGLTALWPGLWRKKTVLDSTRT